jgi:hypothetical protein
MPHLLAVQGISGGWFRRLQFRKIAFQRSVGFRALCADFKVTRRAGIALAVVVLDQFFFA